MQSRFIGQCEICGQIAPVTRDHDHKTQMIRGLLCEKCNSRLGTIEARIRTGQEMFRRARRKKFQVWVNDHKDKIVWWLNQDTGIRYTHNFQYNLELLRQHPRVSKVLQISKNST